MSHLVHLAGCVKNPKQHFAKIEEMIRPSSLFWDVSLFMSVIAGRLRLRERDVG